jgi:hypothetical protein
MDVESRGIAPKRNEGEAMKHLVAALALAFTLAVPQPAPANETWDMVKEEWELRPWAVLLAAPAFIVTAPFWGVKEFLDARERRARAEAKAAAEAKG